MTLNEAIKLFKKEYPEYRVTGYWIKNGEYILNAKLIFSKKGFLVPGQYVVTSSGEVYGTNPMVSDLDTDSMKKI